MVKQLLIIGVSIKCSSFFGKDLYSCFCFWVLQYKTKYIVQIMKMQAANEINKNERGIWGIRIWPH